MIGALFGLARPFLHALDPETAHGLALKGLALLPVRPAAPDDPRLAVMAFGRRFPNPVGLAAGFDKGAEAPDPLLGLGFGFVERDASEVVPEALLLTAKARVIADNFQGG